MSREVTHIGFSDESNWNIGRFRSLGLVTLPKEHLQGLQNELRQVLDQSSVREFKWNKLRGARERFAAIKICDFAIKHACSGTLRIDVLVWDVEDSRHKIKGRDDIANLQRMYYHLFRNVLRMRWPDNAVWRLFPDEHTAMDWNSVKDYLEFSGSQVRVEHSLFGTRLRREFYIDEIVQKASDAYPLLQIADLFSGLAVFSRQKFEHFQRWAQEQTAQRTLLHFEERGGDLSKGDIERFHVLKHLDEECKKRKLGVSLRTNRGLTTLNPVNPINFWLYQPQHSKDKAPIKSGRGGCE